MLEIVPFYVFDEKMLGIVPSYVFDEKMLGIVPSYVFFVLFEPMKEKALAI